MSAIEARRNAERLLEGLENGGLSAIAAATLAEQLDPVIVYVIVSYLREIHPASDPAATAVLERVVRLTSTSPALIRKHREGGQDPVARWFESEYTYRAFRGRASEMLLLIVDKIES